MVASATNGAWELYELSADRSETKNLAKERPEKVKELAAAWTKQLEDFRVVAME